MHRRRHAPDAGAHESRPAFLELKQTAEDTYDVVWKVPARGDRRLERVHELLLDAVPGRS